MAIPNTRNLYFYESGASTQLPTPFRVVAPVWENALLIQDRCGDWWLREINRWDAPDITRQVKEAYAWSLYGLAFPHPEPEPIPNSMTASGEIDC